ncbi:NUDIX hydrolase [Naasia lichenicola]|uniref:NUDIX domain-containing protein n=1 Tax=Naasia lichenicola TaxID=2565933 RepID=A0A4S4FF60_9MICO|nr:NUDIX domain-containing protein [Naasia lichenicola]THG28761.1 NUDIX domain-containing protein [Naasia lichenicola]
MPTPEFVRSLREKVGTSPLWLVGSSAVVLDGPSTGSGGPERVLLVRRADNGNWTTIAGIVEPGEHAAVAAVREVLEETTVVAEVERLAALAVTDEIVYENGDRTSYTTLTFRCRYVSGEARVGDDESSEVAWFPLDALPPMHSAQVRRIRLAAADRPDTVMDYEVELHTPGS